MKAIQIEEFGGPENLKLVDVPDPEPGDGEVLVEVARSGINFADTHAIRNDYLAEQQLPADPRRRGERHDRRRDAASRRSSPPAATRRRSPSPSRGWCPVPDQVSDDQAAALLLQGMTAHALLHCDRPRRRGRDRRGRGRRRRHRQPRRPAREAGRGEGDRPRLERREARAGRAPRRRRDRGLPRRGARRHEGGDPRGQRRREGRRRPAHERHRLRGPARRARPARAHRRLRQRRPPPQRGRDQLPAPDLEVGPRLLADALRRQEARADRLDDRRAARRGGRRATSRSWSAGVYPLADAASAHADIAERRSTGKLLLDPTA